MTISEERDRQTTTDEFRFRHGPSVSRAAIAEHGGRFAIFANQEGHDLQVGEEYSEIQQSPVRQDADRVSLEDIGPPFLAVLLLVMMTWRTLKASIGLWESQDLKMLHPL